MNKTVKNIKWGRLLWVLFLTIYFFFFWKNITSDILGFPYFIPVFIGIYFWTIRLNVEFYFHLPFHQSGYVDKNRYRFLYALLFYPFFLFLFLEVSTFNVLPPVLRGISFLIVSFVGLLFISIAEWIRFVTLKENIGNMEGDPLFNVRFPRYTALILEIIGFPLLFGEILLLFYSLILIFVIIKETKYEDIILRNEQWYIKRSSLHYFFPFF